MSASATELVVNGGFEAANFAGWTLTEPNGFSNVGSDPAFAHSGIYHANLAPDVGVSGTLSQSVVTNAGEAYTLSFWLANDSNLPVNAFSVQFGGATVFATASPPFSATGVYQLFSLDLVGAGVPTLLQFTYRHDADFWRLDDVSLQSTAVPEPGTWALMILGFGAAGATLRRRMAVLA